MEESTTVHISTGFSGPEFASAFGAVILKTWPPRTKTSVNILVNPGVAGHAPEKVHTPIGEIAGRGMMHSVEGQTQELLFDIATSPVHSVTVNDHHYEIRLLDIREVVDEGLNTFRYEFMVTKRPSA